MKDFLKENWFKVGLIAVLLIAVIGYINYLNTKNSLNKRKYDQEVADKLRERQIAETKEAQQAAKLQACLILADSNYDKNWELGCKGFNKESGCTLPRYLAEPLNDDYTEAKATCNSLYK